MRKKPSLPKTPIPEIPEAERHKLGYARVSTNDQDPQLQIDALLAVGVARSDIYQDKISGAADKRVGFDTMLKETAAGDVIYVWKLDRLGRSARQVLDTFHLMTERGVAIRCITQPQLDTSTTMGRLVVTIMAAVAEMERDLIRERTKAGLEASRAAGRIGGRRLRVSDEAIKAARHLGTKAGSEKVGLKTVQFARRVDRLRLKEKKEQANDKQV